MKTLTTYVATVVGLALGSILSVYIWMTLFVGLLKYDYVTASNMLFVLSIVLPVAGGLWALFSKGSWTPAVIGILIYPLLLSTAFGVYEQFQHPVMSDQTNILAAYRGMVAVPVGAIADLVAKAGPFAASAVKTVEGSPILMMIASAIVSALVREIVALAGRTMKPA